MPQADKAIQAPVDASGAQPVAPATPVPSNQPGTTTSAPTTLESVPANAQTVSGFAGNAAERAMNKSKYQAQHAVPEGQVQGQATGAPNLDARVPTYQKVENQNFVAPPPAPVKTAPVTPEQNAANQKAFDAANPAGTKIQDVNHAPSPLPAAPATPATPKKEGQATDFNVGAGREQEITKNLNEGAINAPNLFKDEATFKQAYGYDSADATKKGILDSYWKSRQPQTADDYFNGMVLGTPVTGGTAQYVEAQHRFDSAKPYLGASESTIYSAMAGGKLYPNSALWNDVVKASGGVETPAMAAAKAKYQAKIKADSINRNSAVVLGTAKEEPNPVQKASDELVASKGMDYAKEFAKDVANNPEITKLATDLNATDKKIKDLEAAKKNTLKDIMKNHPGITTSLAYEIANAQNAPLNDEIELLQNEKAQQSADLKYKTDMATKTFEFKVKQDERDVGFQMQKQLAEFQANLEVEKFKSTEKAKTEIEKERMNDPELATREIIKRYRDMGVFPSRSDEAIIDEVKSKVASGSSLGQALSGLEAQFQEKPEYQRVKELKRETMSDVEKLSATQSFDWKKMTHQERVEMDKLMADYDFKTKQGREDAFYKLVAGGMDQAEARAAVRTYSGDWEGATGEDIFNAAPGTVIPSKKYGTLQCAEAVNKIAGTAMGDTLESKMAEMDVKVNSSSNKAPEGTGVGNVVVYQPSKTGAWAKYGHTGIIVGEDGNNWQVWSANLHNKGEISVTPVPKSEIMGYKTGNYIPEKKANANDSVNDAYASEILAGNKIDVPSKNRGAVIKLVHDRVTAEVAESDKVYNDKDRSNIIRSVTGKQPSQTFVENMNKLDNTKASVNEVIKSLNDTSTGPIIGTLRSKVPYDTKAQAVMAQLNALVPGVARGIYGEVGVLTDKDIEQYMKTIPKLSSTKEINDLVGQMLLRTIERAKENNVKNMAKNGYNVRNYLDDYDILNGYGMYDTKDGTPDIAKEVSSNYGNNFQGSGSISLGGKNFPSF